MKLGQEIISCAYVSTGDRAITEALVNANQENTGYLAVTIAEADAHIAADTDNVTNTPTPKVQLLDRADPAQVTAGTIDDVYLRVYGALATINTATGRCGVITKGIVPFISHTGTAASDIGKGIMAPDASDHTIPPGHAVAAAAAGDGTGTVIGRRGSDLWWVDLDAEQAKV